MAGIGWETDRQLLVARPAEADVLSIRGLSASRPIVDVHCRNRPFQKRTLVTRPVDQPTSRVDTEGFHGKLEHEGDCLRVY